MRIKPKTCYTTPAGVSVITSQFFNDEWCFGYSSAPTVHSLKYDLGGNCFEASRPSRFELEDLYLMDEVESYTKRGRNLKQWQDDVESLKLDRERHPEKYKDRDIAEDRWQ